MRRIWFLAHAEILHVVRDHATLAQVLVVPIVQLLVLANAATFTIRNTPTWIVDLDRTPVSRGLVNRLAASGHFDPAKKLRDYSAEEWELLLNARRRSSSTTRSRSRSRD